MIALKLTFGLFWFLILWYGLSSSLKVQSQEFHIWTCWKIMQPLKYHMDSFSARWSFSTYINDIWDYFNVEFVNLWIGRTRPLRPQDSPLDSFSLECKTSCLWNLSTAPAWPSRQLYPIYCTTCKELVYHRYGLGH